MDEFATARAATVDTGAVYERTRRAFVGTMMAVTEEQHAQRVPAAPDWSVRDVLAHVVGLAADLNAQRFPDRDDLGGSAWAARQVEQRRGATLADIVAEWDREGPAFADVLRVFGYEFGSHFAADLHAHHQDVRQALGLARDDDEETIAVALDHYLGFIDELLVSAQWGALEIVAGSEVHRLGAGPQRARLVASPFEVLRALSARRSERQLRALRWEGDVDALVEILRSGFTGGYALPEADLVE